MRTPSPFRSPWQERTQRKGAAGREGEAQSARVPRWPHAPFSQLVLLAGSSMGRMVPRLPGSGAGG